ncbi:transcriptional protein SWT1 [Esox lucius]|uniref:Transcriptional protein SWT1 n=1 Tax=Esox lucius TaxID=8010 RepID=A0A3P8YZW9_ESOLU|nr:transcriptional protein SWT1 [Esox lucius]XP_010870793.2 transcriptional protein SWT1 [Esox lucius]XP_010870794.2 transcriptional protein SWT1 [Esox lucius]
MSNKSKKKKKEKRKPSSEDKEDSSQKQGGSKKHSLPERKQHGCCFTEDKTGKEKGASHFTTWNSTAGNSQKKDREIKKAFYRLGKATTSQGSEGKSTCPLDTLHQDIRKTENMTATSDDQTVDRGYSKTVSSQDNKIKLYQSGEKSPEIQGCSRKFLPEKNPVTTTLSRSSTSHENPSSFFAHPKEQSRMQLKRCRPVEEPDPGKEKTFQTSLSHDPQISLSLSEEPGEKRRNLVRRRSEEVSETQRHQTGRKSPGFSSDKTTRHSYTSPKINTYEKKPNKLNHMPITQKREYVPELSKISKTFKSTCAKVEKSLTKPKTHFIFKIPKKTKTVLPPVNNAIWGDDQEDCKPISTSTSAEVVITGSKFSRHPGSASRFSDSKDRSSAAVNRTQQQRFDTVPETSKGSKKGSMAPVQPSSSKAITFSCNRPTSTKDNIDLYDNDQEMQLTEELHLARSERRLELNVVTSYGELTRMDIDTPEGGATLSKAEDDRKQDLIIVMDTNILLSHLDFVKIMRSRGLGALGLPTVLVPWVVLQELDSLKNGKRLSSSVAQLATPAVHYIYTCLKTQKPRLWGQSMQQASQSSYGLNAENNDDRVLQCCLQYQSLYPERAVILCTNDKNLCSKAILSGVKALSKTDLVDEVDRLKTTGGHNLTPLHVQMHTPTPTRTPSQTSHHQKSVTSPGQQQNDGGEKKGKEERKKAAEEARELSSCVSEMEDCLKGVLSQVLEVEMKAAYEELWTEIVYLKPPWTLGNLLQCFKKHWIAIFGNIVQRNIQQSVESLHKFFSGTSVERCSTVLALSEARKLLQAFGCRSDYGGRVQPALSTLKALLPRILPQPEEPSEETHTSDCDTLMEEEEEHKEEKQTTTPQVSHQEMWVLFENVWNNVCRVSSAVFDALRFDPSSLETRQPIEGPPPPQDALSSLYQLCSAIRELLQAFTRVLSADRNLDDAQALLSFIHSSEIAAVEPRFTASDLLDCLSQPQYREMLCVGVTQLAELNISLERCAEVTSREVAHSTRP